MTTITVDSQTLNQHETDLDTVERVRIAGFRSAAYEALIADLYRYAWPVMLNAIRTGSIVNIKTSLPKRGIPVEERQLLHDSRLREKTSLFRLSAAPSPGSPTPSGLADGTPPRAGA